MVQRSPLMNPPSKLFLQIDEEGFLWSEEHKILDAKIGGSYLQGLRILPDRSLVFTQSADPLSSTNLGHSEGEILIEAFDDPYVAKRVFPKNGQPKQSIGGGQWCIEIPYGLTLSFELSTLNIDEWDRFHGVAENGIPFVMSRSAQESFFDLLDSFDDESITWQGQSFSTPSFWKETKSLEQESYWSEIYRNEVNPGWNLNQAAPALQDMLPRLKLPKSRVLVLGCGEGHDAAFFAKEGHLVTAVDISPEALARGHAKYSTQVNLKFLQADLFALPKEFQNSFDIVFEHTCYCAINPTLRSQMVKIWKQVLTPHGQLMGVFFIMDKKVGPPFGGTEWELRKRLADSFRFIFWGRWRNSIPARNGKELFVLAQKKSAN